MVGRDEILLKCCHVLGVGEDFATQLRQFVVAFGVIVFAVVRIGLAFVTVEYLSRYIIALPTVEATVDVAWNFIVDHISLHFGWPNKIFSDNGTHFTGDGFYGRLPQFYIKHRPTLVKAL